MQGLSHQVKLAVTHHTLTASGDSWQLSSDKPLCFVLDPLKQPESKKGKKKNKKRDGVFNIKNFGAVVDISKLKNAIRIMIGWRARYPWVKSYVSLLYILLFMFIFSGLHNTMNRSIYIVPPFVP